PDLRGGACPSLLLLASAPCAPVHEHTAGAQERRRILDYDGLRAHRADGRDVVAALTRAPLLGPPAHDARLLEPELAVRAPQEPAQLPSLPRAEAVALEEMLQPPRRRVSAHTWQRTRRTALACPASARPRTHRPPPSGPPRSLAAHPRRAPRRAPSTGSSCARR